MTPKSIHQIWLQGKESIPTKYSENISSVIKNNPDYSYHLWDEGEIRNEIRKIGDSYLKKFDALPLLHMKVDMGRYAILFSQGGISVDIDSVALKSFNETPHINDSNFIVSKNSNNQFINNATILVSKENPLMKQLLDEISGDCKWYQDDTSCVMYSTGPIAFTKFVEKHWGEITVLDPVYFEPCSGMDVSCKPNSEKSILNHVHEGTWVNPLYRTVLTTYHNIKPYKIFFFVLLLAIILWLILKK